MFNLANLIISLLSPAAIFIVTIFIDLIFKTRAADVTLILIYLQHVYFGELFGLNLHGDSGAWIPLPYNGTLLLFNLLLDYLLAALVIYISLTVLTKYFSGQNLRLSA